MHIFTSLYIQTVESSFVSPLKRGLSVQGTTFWSQHSTSVVHTTGTHCGWASPSSRNCCDPLFRLIRSSPRLKHSAESPIRSVATAKSKLNVKSQELSHVQGNFLELGHHLSMDLQHHCGALCCPI